MNKKKLIGGMGIAIMLVIMIFVDLSFSKEDSTVVMNNIEALAGQEIDIVKLCPAAGGHCMVNIEWNVLGISIDRD